jgi:hypothetical protein
MIVIAQHLARFTCLPLVAMVLLLSLASCETPHGSAAGGAGAGSGGIGHINIGWPF